MTAITVGPSFIHIPSHLNYSDLLLLLHPLGPQIATDQSTFSDVD